MSLLPETKTLITGLKTAFTEGFSEPAYYKIGLNSIQNTTLKPIIDIIVSILVFTHELYTS